jgi:hypothetical protein
MSHRVKSILTEDEYKEGLELSKTNIRIWMKRRSIDPMNAMRTILVLLEDADPTVQLLQEHILAAATLEIMEEQEKENGKANL